MSVEVIHLTTFRVGAVKGEKVAGVIDELPLDGFEDYVNRIKQKCEDAGYKIIKVDFDELPFIPGKSARIIYETPDEDT